MYKSAISIFKCYNTKVSPSCIIIPKIFPIHSQVIRNLYTKEALGVDGFINARGKTKSQFAGMDMKFKNKMKDYTNSDTKNMIFTEDLKNMIYLAEDDEDVNLVISMAKRFNRQNQELRFGNFVFGSVVMRMFYLLNKPDAAINSFKDEALDGFFDQLVTYQLLLDILYENGKYSDVRNTFDLIKSKQIQGTKYPKNIVVLTLAACYKENTKESYEYAKTLWHELNEVGHVPMRKSVTFFAGLALRQEDPKIALQVISSTKNPNYVTIRNIKVASLAAIGRLDDALPILKFSINVDNPLESKKHTFCVDVIDALREIVNNVDDLELKQEFTRVDKYLQEQGHITNETLDQQLCSEIQNVTPHMQRKDSPAFIYRQNDNQQNSRYQRRQRDYTYRPSLSDMQ